MASFHLAADLRGRCCPNWASSSMYRTTCISSALSQGELIHQGVQRFRMMTAIEGTDLNIASGPFRSRLRVGGGLGLSLAVGHFAHGQGGSA